VTQEQEAVCASTADRVRVLAGGGTGKTHTMVNFARLNPDRCLMIAYTNANVGVFQQRISSPLVEVCTADSLALGILREHPDFQIPRIDRPQAVDRLAGECLAGAFIPNTAGNRKILISAMDYMLARLYSLEGFTSSSSSLPAANLAELVETLFSKLAKNRLATFNIWEYLAVYLLESDPVFLARQSKRWATIIVDEAQDITPLLARLIKLLSGSSRLVIVGDPCQEIFCYSGAGISWFTDPGWEEYHLTTCFRSAPEILEVVNRTRTDGLTITPANPDVSGTVERWDYQPGKRDWDDFFASEISSTLEAGTVAVLADTHAELDTVAEILEDHEIPYLHNNPNESDATPASRRSKEGTVTLSTIHSAKGMEWDSVHVAGMGSLVHPTVLAGRQERNMQHVAVSRPRTHLSMYFQEGATRNV
jgi:hypothetical protein